MKRRLRNSTRTAMPSTTPGKTSGSEPMTSMSHRTASRRRTTIQPMTSALTATALALPIPTRMLFHNPETVSPRVATAT